jgi:hypothetical protein
MPIIEKLCLQTKEHNTRRLKHTSRMENPQQLRLNFLALFTV